MARNLLICSPHDNDVTQIGLDENDSYKTDSQQSFFSKKQSH